MSWLQRCMLGMAGAIVAACASSGGSGRTGVAAGSTPPPPTSERRSSNVITQSELEGSGSQDALDAIRRLRPNFLTTRGAVTVTGSDPGIVVYANGIRLGGTGALSGINVQDIKQIQFLSAGDATQAFGTGHPHGAIVVTRK